MGTCKERLEKLRGEDLSKIKALAEKTQKGFQKMIDLLDPKKYASARSYIENLFQNIATFFS